ncbi:MAG: glycosyltransferase [Rhizobiales bacterium]|nr:glycosyltransferase [Rhizobacter sp.]
MGSSVLYLGPLSGTSLHRRNAFVRLGHRVRTIEPRRLLPPAGWVDKIEWHLSPSLLGEVVERRLDALLDGQEFDIAFADNGSLLTPRSVRRLRRRCRRVVNFNHDDPFGQRDRVRFSAYRAAVAEYDLVVVVRPANVDEARRSGARQVLLHPMVSDEVAHAPRTITPALRAKWQAEVAFVGSWMPERGPFLLDLVRRGIPLSIFGPAWQRAPEWPQLRPHHRADYLDGDDYAYAVQCAKISLGMLSKGNRDRHTTRSMEIPALGGLLCAERTDEHTAFYREGEEAVFWADSSECAAVCQDLLGDEPRRLAIAARGQQRSWSNGYTSENLIRKLFGALQ